MSLIPGFCQWTTPLGLNCRTVGGVSPYGVFIAPWLCGPSSDGATPSSTYTFTQSSSGTITGSTGGTPSTYYQICQDNEVASLVTVPDASNIISNGTFYSTNTCEVSLFNMSQDLINRINTLMAGRWRLIILGNDGNYYFMGLNNPVYVSAITGGINKALGDLNGMTITFESKEQFGLTLMDPTFAQTLLGYAT
jgi:hypothetical protein